MSNKTFFIILPIVIILSLYINYKIYGNSNSTSSITELAQYYQHEHRKKKSAKVMADYMYKRIKFYQEIDDFYERYVIFDSMYNALQNMDLDKE